MWLHKCINVKGSHDILLQWLVNAQRLLLIYAQWLWQIWDKWLFVQNVPPTTALLSITPVRCHCRCATPEEGHWSVNRPTPKSRFPIGWQVGFPSDAKLLIERRDTNCSRSFWWTRNRLCQHVVCAAAVPYNKDHIYSGLCADTLSICGEDARKRRVGLASISSSWEQNHVEATL